MRSPSSTPSSAATSDLADLYLRRAEAAQNGEQAAPYRLSLAKLLREKLGDTPGAIDQLEAIVSEVPWQKDAIEALEALTRDDGHKARVVEILRPLYERSDDWRLLIRLNEERFGLAEDAHEKVSVLRETARLWETRGGDQKRAFHATRVAFELDPEDGETRAELERIAGALGAYDALAESYEQGISNTSDDVAKRELLGLLAKIYDEKIDDPRRALGAYGRLSQIDPSDPEPLDAMDTLSVLLSDWYTLIDVLTRKSALVADDENASIWRRIAETKLDMLEDSAGAVTAYERALELDPDSPFTVDALINLYEPQNNAKRLVELYTRRVELAGESEGDLRYDLNVAAAACYEQKLDDRREAINSLGAALEARPSDGAVLRALERLYRAAKMWEELLENLKLQASAAAAKEDRVALRTAMGDLYGAELEAPSESLEQYRLVLEDEPTHPRAIDAVRRIGEAREELRLEAARVLEPVLRGASRWKDLVAVLELRLKAQTEPSDRARTLRAIAHVESEERQRPSEALTALLRALEDTADDAELHAEIEAQAAKCDGWARYADALTTRAGGLYDAVVAKDLFVRLGKVAEGKLDDPKRAVEAYAKAVEHAGDELDLLVALDRLYARLDDKKALADILERRVPLATEADQADLYHRLAVIQLEAFGEKQQGLATLRLALERSPEHAASRASLEGLTADPALFEEAAEALEGVYKARGDHAALAGLFEKRIQHAGTPAERVKMRLELARVLEEQAKDPAAAQAALERGFADDPTDLDVLAEIERLAPVTDGWKSAAGALEKAIAAHELPSDTARDLWVRIATWYKDKAHDVASAERAYGRALEHDATSEFILREVEALQRAPGRERDLVATLRRLAALDGMQGHAAELRREAKGLAETLGDRDLAEAILREMIASDEADAWALAELTKVREAAGDWKQVFELLVRQAELAAEAGKIKELRHAAAGVARDKLADDARAIDLYAQIFEDEPSDTKAAAALRELYEKGEKHKDLLALLGRLIDLAETPAARVALRLESAALCIDKLEATTEATEHLRAVLDEDAGNEKATLLLSTLLEKSGRDQELADLLKEQIELAAEKKETQKELSFRVRLGEVSETRLNDPEKAIETFQGVVERDGAHKGALHALARLFEQRGEKAEAAKQLEVGARRVSPGDDAVKLALRLADLYGTLKQDADVRRVLEAALVHDARSADVRKRLHALYEKLGAWGELADLTKGDAEAAEAVAEKVSLYKKGAEIHASKRGDPGAAAELLEKATELQPGDRDLLLALCDAYSASGRGKAAVEVLQKVVESFGGRRAKELAPIHHRLAKAYLAEGDKDARAHRARDREQDRRRLRRRAARARRALDGPRGERRGQQGRAHRPRRQDVPRAPPPEARRQRPHHEGRGLLLPGRGEPSPGRRQEGRADARARARQPEGSRRGEGAHGEAQEVKLASVAMGPRTARATSLRSVNSRSASSLGRGYARCASRWSRARRSLVSRGRARTRSGTVSSSRCSRGLAGARSWRW